MRTGSTAPYSVGLGISEYEKFRRDGVIVLRSALGKRSLALAEETFDYRLAHPSPCANQLYSGSDSTFYCDATNLDAWPTCRRLLDETSLGDMVANLFDSNDVWMYFAQVILKRNGNRRAPWHQDASYLPIQGADFAVVWITLDHVAREDSLEFICGSHREPLLHGCGFETGPADSQGTMPQMAEIEVAREYWNIASWSVEPGDLVIFHPAILHGGTPTRTGRRRRTLSLYFFGPDARFLERRKSPLEFGPFAPDLVQVLHRNTEPSDPLGNAIFFKLRTLRRD